MTRSAVRRRLDGRELVAWYVGTASTAVVAGVVAGALGVSVVDATNLGCRRSGGGDVPPEGGLTCPDGTGLAIPGLLSAATGVFAVLAVSAVLIARRADPPTLVRTARHAMWLSAVSVAVPLLGWAGLALASGAVWAAVVALGVVAATAVPPLVSVRSPRHSFAVVVVFLVPAAAILLLAPWLPLLAPVAAAATGSWSVALYLLHTARHAAHLSRSGHPGSADGRP